MAFVYFIGGHAVLFFILVRNKMVVWKLKEKLKAFTDFFLLLAKRQGGYEGSTQGKAQLGWKNMFHSKNLLVMDALALKK